MADELQSVDQPKPKRGRGRPRKVAELRKDRIDDAPRSAGVDVGSAPEPKIETPPVDAGKPPAVEVPAERVRQKPGREPGQVLVRDPFWFVLRAR